MGWPGEVDRLRVGMCTKWIDEPFTGVGRYTSKVLTHMMDAEGAPEFHLTQFGRLFRIIRVKHQKRPAWIGGVDRKPLSLYWS